MERSVGYVYDVFISYSPPDREWVDTWLLPRLERAGLRTAIDYRDFVVGMPRLQNIERAVECSRRTIVVLTPDWVNDEWNAFAALLVKWQDPAACRRRLLPLLLKPCQLPPDIDMLEPANFSAEKHWERECNRLVRDVADVIPVPPPWVEGGTLDLKRWGQWLRRYRRELRRGMAALVALWLIAALLFQWPPFSQRLGWQKIASISETATRHLATVQNVLLLSTTTPSDDCNTRDSGIWLSEDRGATWQPVAGEPLLTENGANRCIRASITSFAYTSFAYAANSAQTVIYATTTAGRFRNTVGLLRSDDLGRSWAPVAPATFRDKNLAQVVVAANDPHRLLVVDEKGGLYGTLDGGQAWSRLDGSDACPDNPKNAWPSGAEARSALALGQTVYLGTKEGLYASDDGGQCWEKQGNDDDAKFYSYEALAEIPGRDDEILAITKDYTKNIGEASFFLWIVKLGKGRVSPPLWQSIHTAMALYVDAGRVDAGQPATWYVATHTGLASRGTLDAPVRSEDLPMLTRCLVQFCLTDLSSNAGAGPPLLLADGSVYRLEAGPWFNSIWP